MANEAIESLGSNDTVRALVHEFIRVELALQTAMGEK